MKNKNEEIVSVVKGKWNGVLEHEYAKKIPKIDTNSLKTYRKRVVPVQLQKANESRRLWHQVTRSLQNSDFHSVSFYKNFIEKQQRLNEKTRREQSLVYSPENFYKTKFDIDKYSSKITIVNKNATESNENHDLNGSYCWLHKKFLN